MSPPIAVGQLLDGKYRVEALIGEGGFGVVVRARHEATAQAYALKILLEARDAHTIARFRREARASAGIDSDHVTKVHDVGQLDGGAPYMVMDLLEGCDLDALVGERGPLPVAEAVEYVLQACEPLAAAHAMGLVHRDIKPSNLFLTRRSDGTPFIKLLDFGISKHALSDTAAITATGDVLGTPQFMSPEQLVSSRDVDARSDIWSLGASLHELIAGKPPFDAPTLAEVLAAVLRQDPVPLRQLRHDVPEAVEQAVLRCLEKDPLERYASVAELASALAPHAPPRARASADRTQRALESAPTVRTPPQADDATQVVDPTPAWTSLPAAPPVPLAPAVPLAVPLAAPAARGFAWPLAAVPLVVAVCAGGVVLGWHLGLRGETAPPPAEAPRHADGIEPDYRPDRGDAHLGARQRREIIAELDAARDALDDADPTRALERASAVAARLEQFDVGVPSQLSAAAHTIAMQAQGLAAVRMLRATSSGADQLPALSDMGVMVDQMHASYRAMWAHRRYPFVVCSGVEYGRILRQLAEEMANASHAKMTPSTLRLRDALRMRWTMDARAALEDAERADGPAECRRDAHKLREAIRQP